VEVKDAMVSRVRSTVIIIGWADVCFVIELD